MTRYCFLPVVIMLLASVVACDNTTVPAATALVVDGSIDSDGYPVIILTKTISPGSDKEINVAECVVRWGKVTISDGEHEVIMTGSSNDDYFPPYIYRTYEMRGIPGKTYTVTATYDGMSVTSTCRMPQPAEITGISMSKVEDSDSLVGLSMKFTPAPGETYYHLLARVRGKSGRLLPAFLGTIKTDGTAAGVEVPVYAPKCDTDEDDFSPHFKTGDTVDVALCTVTREVYDFWLSYDDEVTFGGNQFVTSAGNLSSNISDGYGVWSAQGVTRRTVTVGEP